MLTTILVVVVAGFCILIAVIVKLNDRWESVLDEFASRARGSFQIVDDKISAVARDLSVLSEVVQAPLCDVINCKHRAYVVVRNEEGRKFYLCRDHDDPLRDSPHETRTYLSA